MFVRLSLAALVSAAVALPSRPSLACSPLYCTPAHVTPAATTSIPAGVPAFAFNPTYNSTGPAGDIGFQIVDVHGQVVPTTIVADPAVELGKLVLFATPLVAGSYKLKYSETCNGGGPGSDGGVGKLMAQPFTVVAAAPLPTTSGTLSIASQGVQTVNVRTASGSCTTAIQAATAQLAFKPSATLAPYMPLARIITRVDGKEWASTRYGDELRDGSMQFDPWRRVQQLHARCAVPTASFDDDGLTLGTHHVEVSVHLAGVTSDPPPLTLDVTLRCDGIADGGTNDPPLSTGGCSVAGARSPGAASSLFALLLLLAWLRRRP